MTIKSVNIGEKQAVKWRGKTVYTGIFKYAVETPIYLGFEDVEHDAVVDRKYHGGIDKACYAYSAEAYEFWSALYPESEFPFGFFGENMTIEGLNESEIKIGNRYKIGGAILEVSQPREPCFKLGVRFGSQKILKPFINAPYPGIYFRVIEAGEVKSGDQLTLIFKAENELSVLAVYRLIYGLADNPKQIEKALSSTKLGEASKRGIRKQFKIMT